MGYFLVIILVIVFLVAINRTPGKNKLQNTENIIPGSRVVGVKPYVKGSKQYKHYEVTVTFADGSSYTTDLGERGFMTIGYNQQHLNKAIQEAVTVHEEEASKKTGSSTGEESTSSNLVENDKLEKYAMLDESETNTDVSTRSTSSVSAMQGGDGKVGVGGHIIGSHVNREEATAYYSRVQSFYNDILSEIKKNGTVEFVSGNPSIGRDNEISEDKLCESAHILAYNFMKPTPENVSSSVMIKAFAHKMSQSNHYKAEEITSRLLKVNNLFLMRAALHQGDVPYFSDWMACYSLFEKEKNDTYYVVVAACEKAIRTHIPEIESMRLSQGDQVPVWSELQHVVNPIMKVIYEEERKASYNPTQEIENESIGNNSICYCRKCGFKLLPDSTFCSRCGARID